MAIPKREAWILAGFVPRDDPERERLASERQRLGFDPTTLPHRLRGGGDKREAKLAHANLVPGHEREQQCLTSLDLAELSRRGEGAGLAGFLAEVNERIVGRLASPASR